MDYIILEGLMMEYETGCPYALIEITAFQTPRFNWTYSIARETEEPSSVVENIFFFSQELSQPKRPL
jgi:hypothetical protein